MKLRGNLGGMKWKGNEGEDKKMHDEIQSANRQK